MRIFPKVFILAPLLKFAVLRIEELMTMGMKKVENIKNDTQKIVPPWFPCPSVKPFRFRKDKKPER
jgi:hypothetical protein